MKHRIIYIITIIITHSASLNSIDNPHFYRATNMFLEPRLEHDFLSTFYATLSGGSSSKGRSSNNDIVPLLDIYGTQSLVELITNTSYSKPNNYYDFLLTEVAKLPKRTNFGKISIDGSFSILEANLSFAQNFSKGLFFFSHLPVRKLKIDSINITDLSPNDHILPNKNNYEWQALLQNINPLLIHYQLDISPTTSIGVGDLTSWMGWTHNYQETTIIDFIDITAMLGFLAPTGKKKIESKLFSLPTGYNGHWGFPLCVMLSVGCYEWVTVGAYLNSLFFIKSNRLMHLKTDTSQSGLIKLASGNVSVHKGPLINSGIYCKADHVGHGVSCTIAYSFASQQREHLTQNSPIEFNRTIINSDSMLAGWNMHTFNFALEYDFTQENDTVGNRIGLFYNLQVAGKRTFNTNCAGGSYGLDISWYL
ncbi:MAG TPA: hypothetical protein VLB80_01210 [Candidatus Babeliales bacterium]|nr:hypothetical protein [Candidatus Babeliales bacterium]